MISTTLGYIVDASDALERIAALPLPAKAAYDLSKLSHLVAAEVKIFHERRNQIVNELGTEREPNQVERMNGQKQVFELKPDNPHLEAFIVRVVELRDLPVELAWKPFDGTALFKDGIVVTAADLRALGPLVCWSQEDGAAPKGGGV